MPVQALKRLDEPIHDNVLRPEVKAWTQQPEPQKKQRDRPWIDQGIHPADWAQEERTKQKAVQTLDSVDEVNTLVTYFLENGQFRDALMFVVGCNTGLRISDVIQLRWKDIAGDTYLAPTQKTGHLEEHAINKAIKEAAALYRRKLRRPYNPDDYIFVSEGPRSGHVPVHLRAKGEKASDAAKTSTIQPIRTESAARIVTKAAKATGLYRPGRHVSTHSARKSAQNALYGAVDGIQLSDNVMQQVAGAWMAQMFAGHKKARTTQEHYLTNKLVLAAGRELNLGLAAIEAYKEKEAAMEPR